MRASAAALLFVASAAVSGPARAQDASNVALGEALFRDGRSLLERGDVEAACKKLEASQKLDPRAGTLVNLAACHQMAGRLATSWAAFLDAARLAAAGNPPDRKLESLARARAAALAPIVPQLRIAVTAPAADLVLRLDGRELPQAAWDAEIPVDAGERRLEATRPGHEPFATTVRVAEGTRVTRVEVPALVALPPSAAPEAPRPVPLAAAPLPVRTAESPSALLSPPFLVGALVTVVSASAGTYFGLRAIDGTEERERLCPNRACSPEGFERQSDAVRDANVATALFVVAGVGAAVAIGTLLWPRSPGASPALGPARAGGALRF